MSGNYLGGCGEFVQAHGLDVRCCDSCHEDFDDYGVDMMTIEQGPEHSGWAVPCSWWEVCCAVYNAVRGDEFKHGPPA